MAPTEFAEKFVKSLSLKQKVALLNAFENPDFIIEKDPKSGNSYMYLIDTNNLEDWISAFKDLVGVRLDHVESCKSDSVVYKLGFWTLRSYNELFVDRNLRYSIINIIGVSPYYIENTKYYFDEYVEMIALHIQNHIKDLPPPFQLKSMY